MEYLNDIIGKKIGKLTIKSLNKSERYGSRFRHFYDCVCECGNLKIIERHNLTGKKPHTTSCGCMKKRSAAESPCWDGYGEISGRFWTDIKTKAESRKITFAITIKQAWDLFEKQKARCALTGLPISIKCGWKNYRDKTGSLDRIDSEKGYIKDNIQWVHKDVNIMKNAFSIERFVEICKLVANRSQAE